MKLLIVDDEELSILFIEKIVKENFDNFKLILRAGNIFEAAKLIKQHEPDLLLLDITLQTNISLELFELFDKDQLNVIFITGYKNYGIEAIKVNAIDYILKPIVIDELKEAIKKALLIIEKKKNYVAHNSASDKILLSVNNLKMPVDNQEIIKVKSSGSYSVIYLKNGKTYTSTKNLGYYEEILTKSSFIRIHHSTLININHIKSYDSQKGGAVEMTDGNFEKVSNRKKALFLRIFNK